MKLTLLAIGMYLLAFSSCSEKQQPNDIVLAYINALNKSDYDAAKKLCDEETKAYVDMQQSNMDAVDESVAEQYSNAKVALIGQPQTKGDTMIYKYKSSNIPSERKIMLIKKNNEWLVHNTYEEETLYAPIGEPIYSEEAVPLEGENGADSNATEF